MTERYPTPSQPERSKAYDSIVQTLEFQLIARGRPVQYDIATGRAHYGSQPSELNTDALAGMVTTDAEDPYLPGHPLLYHAMLFTKHGVMRTGIVAELAQVLGTPDSDGPLRSLVYRFRADGTVGRRYVQQTDYDHSTTEVEDMSLQELQAMADLFTIDK